MNLMLEQAKHTYRALAHYEWTKGREMDSAALVNHQQVIAKLNDLISKLEMSNNCECCEES